MADVIKLLDENIEKTFILNKMGALKLVKFTHKLLSGLDGFKNLETQEIANIKQAVETIMQSGREIDGANPNHNISTTDLLPTLLNVVRSIITGVNNELQDEILSDLINCVILQNGAIPIKLSTNPMNAEYYVDNYISGIETIYKLCWAVLKLNYEGSFKRFFSTAET